jgi:hypothetical protein
MTPVKIRQTQPELSAFEKSILPLGGAVSKLLRLLQGIVLMTHTEFRNNSFMRSENTAF